MERYAVQAENAAAATDDKPVCGHCGLGYPAGAAGLCEDCNALPEPDSDETCLAENGPMPDDKPQS